jgi:hypothetical protein
MRPIFWPTWLSNVHRDLDAAVSGAYGWPAGISEDDVLEALLELNRTRSAGVVRGNGGDA